MCVSAGKKYHWVELCATKQAKTTENNKTDGVVCLRNVSWPVWQNNVARLEKRRSRFLYRTIASRHITLLVVCDVSLKS